jgi:hypothetical protein
MRIWLPDLGFVAAMAGLRRIGGRSDTLILRRLNRRGMDVSDSVQVDLSSAVVRIGGGGGAVGAPRDMSPMRLFGAVPWRTFSGGSGHADTSDIGNIAEPT